MTKYLFSKKLEAFEALALKRMEMGLGAVLLLTGEPGGGKTSFAYALANKLGANLFKYQCAPDRERNLLYDYDVDGIVQRTGAWIKGLAWEAFEASQTGYAVLLIDEADKTHANFDAFLLELLEELRFRAPGNGYIQGDPSRLLVIITSNAKREFRGEVLRRCQRIEVPFPEGDRLRAIIRQTAGIKIPDALLNCVVKIGAHIRATDANLAPSPKEMALCLVDLINLKGMDDLDGDIWREVAASYLIKSGGAKGIDQICKYKWAVALLTDAIKI